MISHIKEAYYQSRFRRAVALAESANELDSANARIAALIKIQALFELHETGEATRLLQYIKESLASESLDSSSAWLIGRSAFLNRDFECALSNFLHARRLALSAEEHFKAEMAKIACYVGLSDLVAAQAVFDDLSQCLDTTLSEDLQIMFWLGYGNHQRLRGKFSEAAAAVQRALSLSASQNWLYFIQRSFYERARIFHSQRDEGSLKTVLELLRSLIDPSESRYLLYLVNRDFANGQNEFRTPIEFDDRFMKVRIADSWHEFARRPLLYRFLRLLANEPGFTSKFNISRKLWPEDTYDSNVHDLRIYNIATRARAAIERNMRQPIVLLANQEGYRLAVNESNSDFRSNKDSRPTTLTEERT